MTQSATIPPPIRTLAQQACEILENSMFEFTETGQRARKLAGDIRDRLAIDAKTPSELLEAMYQAMISGTAVLKLGIDYTAEHLAEKQDLAARAIYKRRFPEASPETGAEHFQWYRNGYDNPESCVHYSNVAFAIMDAGVALSAAHEIPAEVVPKLQKVDIELTPDDRAILHIEKAARGLAQHPDHKAELSRFVDYWGMDAYEPPSSVYQSVRKLVTAFLILTDEQAEKRGCELFRWTWKGRTSSSSAGIVIMMRLSGTSFLSARPSAMSWSVSSLWGGRFLATAKTALRSR